MSRFDRKHWLVRHDVVTDSLSILGVEGDDFPEWRDGCVSYWVSALNEAEALKVAKWIILGVEAEELSRTGEGGYR